MKKPEPLKRCIEDYQDILYRIYPEPKTRRPMPMDKRAAQFAPFAALVGHEAAVKEVARRTQAKKILDETEKAVIDLCLRNIEEKLHKQEDVYISLEYFEEDDLKEGGDYRKFQGQVIKIDTYQKQLCLRGDRKVFIDDIDHLEIMPSEEIT